MQDWHIKLRPNCFAAAAGGDKCGSGYVAEVQTRQALRNADLAERIARGSGLRPDTILSVLNMRDEAVRDAIGEGYTVQDGVCRIAPRVAGKWESVVDNFDRARHRCTCDLTPTAELRRFLAKQKVHRTRSTFISAFIKGVLDARTHQRNATLTPGHGLFIYGARIKVLPEPQPEPQPADPAIGVFFVDASGTEIPLEAPLITNQPKELLVQVPPLAPGTYHLRIKTRYTTGPRLLNAPRTITFDRPLTVEELTIDN